MLQTRLPSIAESNFSSDFIEQTKNLIKPDMNVKSLSLIIKMMHTELRCPVKNCSYPLKACRINLKCTSSNQRYNPLEFINQIPTTILYDSLKNMCLEDIFQVFHLSKLYTPNLSGNKDSDHDTLKPISEEVPSSQEEDKSTKFLSIEVNRLMKEIMQLKNTNADLKKRNFSLLEENSQLKQRLNVMTPAKTISQTAAASAFKKIGTLTCNEPKMNEATIKTSYLEAANNGKLVSQQKKSTKHPIKLSSNIIRKACTPIEDKIIPVYVTGFRRCKLSIVKGILKLVGIQSRKVPQMRFFGNVLEILIRESFFITFQKCLIEVPKHEQLKNLNISLDRSHPSINETERIELAKKDLTKLEKILPNTPHLKGVIFYLKSLIQQNSFKAQNEIDEDDIDVTYYDF